MERRDSEIATNDVDNTFEPIERPPVSPVVNPDEAIRRIRADGFMVKTPLRVYVRHGAAKASRRRSPSHVAGVEAGQQDRYRG
jgi:hypothetical protein